jgi:hypothetical protein
LVVEGGLAYIESTGPLDEPAHISSSRREREKWMDGPTICWLAFKLFDDPPTITPPRYIYVVAVVVGHYINGRLCL